LTTGHISEARQQGERAVTVISTEQPGAEVTVSISGCVKEDAHAVFSVLRACFPSDRGPGDLPQYAATGRVTVWTSAFDVSRAEDVRGRAEPLPLTAPVTVTLLGGCHVVDEVRDCLAAAFSLLEEGKVSGDQEKELQLRLESLDAPGTATVTASQTATQSAAHRA
jgi:hypothetical protein